MKKYSVTIGAYVRSYAHFEVEAASDGDAQTAAIAKYKTDSDDIMFDETDWSNVALPSIVELVDEEGELLVQGHEFSLNADDDLQYAARDLLNAAVALCADLLKRGVEHGPDATAWDAMQDAIAKAKGNQQTQKEGE